MLYVIYFNGFGEQISDIHIKFFISLDRELNPRLFALMRITAKPQYMLSAIIDANFKLYVALPWTPK